MTFQFAGQRTAFFTATAPRSVAAAAISLAFGFALGGCGGSSSADDAGESNPGSGPGPGTGVGTGTSPGSATTPDNLNAVSQVKVATAVLITDDPVDSQGHLRMVTETVVTNANGVPYTIAGSDVVGMQSIQTRDATIAIRWTAQTVTTLPGGVYTPYAAGLLIDQSGSMDTNDPTGSRIAGARRLIDLGTDADNLQTQEFPPFTVLAGPYLASAVNKTQLKGSLGTKNVGATPLYDSIISGCGNLNVNQPGAGRDSSAAFAQKALVVFTDGDDTESKYDATSAARLCGSLGVKVVAIGLARSGSISSSGESALRSLARLTDGNYYLIDDASKSGAVFASVGGLLPGTQARTQIAWKGVAYDVRTGARVPLLDNTQLVLAADGSYAPAMTLLTADGKVAFAQGVVLSDVLQNPVIVDRSKPMNYTPMEVTSAGPYITATKTVGAPLVSGFCMGASSQAPASCSMNTRHVYGSIGAYPKLVNPASAESQVDVTLDLPTPLLSFYNTPANLAACSFTLTMALADSSVYVLGSRRSVGARFNGSSVTGRFTLPALSQWLLVGMSASQAVGVAATCSHALLPRSFSLASYSSIMVGDVPAGGANPYEIAGQTVGTAGLKANEAVHAAASTAYFNAAYAFLSQQQFTYSSGSSLFPTLLPSFTCIGPTVADSGPWLSATPIGTFPAAVQVTDARYNSLLQPGICPTAPMPPITVNVTPVAP